MYPDEYSKEQEENLRYIIGDYWYYMEADCYVPSAYLTIPSIDKTNLVSIIYYS